jgi:hypothetical protein
MDLLAQIAARLNVAANAFGKLLAPVAFMPGWLSNTVAAALLGLVTLIVFKYTSNQRALRRVRDDITAHLLALKLFPESPAVSLRAQGRVLRGALALLCLAAIPMLVMIVPMALFLGQMDQWYRCRPLRVGEEANVGLKLTGERDAAWPGVKLAATPAAEILKGPIRIIDRREIWWTIKARESGYHSLQFQVGQETVEKELAVGDGFMRVSAERPGWNWWDIVCQPLEQPFRPGAAVREIGIDYPLRASWTCGANWWIVYCFVVSMFFAFCLRPLFNVQF